MICVLARVRKWFDGAGWFVGAAVVLLVFSLLALLAGLQVPDSVLWTGQQVTGTEQRGLVYYRWQGQSYSLDVQGFGSSKAVSVYFNPSDPSQGDYSFIAFSNFSPPKLWRSVRRNVLHNSTGKMNVS